MRDDRAGAAARHRHVQLAFALPELVSGRGGLCSFLPWHIGPARELVQITSNPRVPWWSTGVSLVQLWAAIELIRSTERRRLAATLYGALSTAVTIWLIWPQMFQLDGIVGSGTHLDSDRRSLLKPPAGSRFRIAT